MTQKPSASQPTISEIRRERERGEMTERIMNIARDMFVHDGFEAVTLRKLAKAIEYSPGTIYQYFKDKKSLVMEIIRRDSEDLRRHLFECSQLTDPVDRVIEMARRYANWGIKHPNHYRLMLAPPPAWAEQDIELRAYERPPLEQEALFLLRQIVEEGIQSGVFKAKHDDPGLIASTLWAGIHGAIMLEISMTPKDRELLGVQNHSFEKRFDKMIEAFLDAFYRNAPLLDKHRAS